MVETGRVSITSMLAVDPLGFVGSGWGLHGLSLFQPVQQMFDWIGLWGIWGTVSAIAIVVCRALIFMR